MDNLTNAEMVQSCVDLIANPNNWLNTAVYGGGFLVLTVFALLKKSLPQFVAEMLKGILNAVKRK